MGLQVLKELVRAFQYEMEDNKRKMLIQIAENFFPILESMMISTIQNISGNG